MNIRQKTLDDSWVHLILKLAGFLYSAQCKWRNGENNRTLTINVYVYNPIPNPNPDPNHILHPKPNPKRLFSPLRHLHCATCTAPNTDSQACVLWR